MGGRRIRTSAAIATLVGLLWAAPALAGPSGQITQAVGNSDTSLGSFTGSATWDDGSGCPNLDATPCEWIAVMTVQPHQTVTPGYPCSGDNWRYPGDPLVLVTWTSDAQTVYGTVAFDGQSFPILTGTQRQFLCLYIGYPGPPFNYVCANPDPYCPAGILEMQFLPVASRDFFPQALGGGDPGPGDPGDPGTVGGGGGGGGGGTTSVPFTIKEQKPTATLAKTTAVSRARAALKRKYGRTYTRGKKRLSCKRRSSKEYRCTYSLSYRKKTRRGTVTVKRISDGVKATVKPR